MPDSDVWKYAKEKCRNRFKLIKMRLLCVYVWCMYVHRHRYPVYSAACITFNVWVTFSRSHQLIFSWFFKLILLSNGRNVCMTCIACNFWFIYRWWSRRLYSKHSIKYLSTFQWCQTAAGQCSNLGDIQQQHNPKTFFDSGTDQIRPTAKLRQPLFWYTPQHIHTDETQL